MPLWGAETPANSVVFLKLPPAPRSGTSIPDRSVELRRAVSASRASSSAEGGVEMRHIGVDLHKTNFVACFIGADDAQRLETYPLTRDGLARFKRQLRKVDEVALRPHRTFTTSTTR